LAATSVSNDPLARLIAANAEFYRAFAGGDVAGLASLWAGHEDIVCIHPGHPPRRGRGDVLASWYDIASAPPPVVLGEAHAFVRGDAGIVTCTELIGDVRLAATNLFEMSDGRWRMILHQAGQIVTPPGRADRPAGPPGDADAIH
jgi:ketosteroid isomerase-like protein